MQGTRSSLSMASRLGLEPLLHGGGSSNLMGQRGVRAGMTLELRTQLREEAPLF